MFEWPRSILVEFRKKREREPSFHFHFTLPASHPAEWSVRSVILVTRTNKQQSKHTVCQCEMSEPKVTPDFHCDWDLGYQQSVICIHVSADHGQGRGQRLSSEHVRGCNNVIICNNSDNSIWWWIARASPLSRVRRSQRIGSQSQSPILQNVKKMVNLKLVLWENSLLSIFVTSLLK